MSERIPGWYPIPGYSGYMANKQGEILNLKTRYKTKGGNAGRYLKVSVYRDGDDAATLQYVHDLVCRAFHGLPEDGQVVKHKDDDRWNNRWDNVEWGSQSDNIKETYSRGIRQPTYGPRVSKEGFEDREDYYHLSFKDGLSGIWTPGLPAGSELPSGQYKEPPIARISVSENIEGCLHAIYPNISHLFEEKKYPYVVMYVYQPTQPISGLITNKELVGKKYVWDAHLTKECWLTKPSSLLKTAKIKVFSPNRKKTRHTHPFNDKSLPLKSVGPQGFDWEIIEMYNKTSQESFLKNHQLTDETKETLYYDAVRQTIALSALDHIQINPPESAVTNANLEEPLLLYSDDIDDDQCFRLVDGAGRLIKHRRSESVMIPVRIIRKESFIKYDFHQPIVSNEARATWDPRFAPAYTPFEMLEMGVFEGKYINSIKGLPASWYQYKNVLGKKDEPDPTVNYFGIKARQPLSVWKKNGWIKTDKNGWFEWYCHYYLGRRLGDEDDWQIGRWRSAVARHQGAITKSGQLKDLDKRRKQRQTLLQWGWDSRVPYDEKALQRNLDRLKRKHSISIEEYSGWMDAWQSAVTLPV